MNKIDRMELDSALVDVRKAFRLLHAYQRRIIDTAKFITDTLSKSIHSGFSVFSGNAPKNGYKMELNRWAWDWLNMYTYEIYYGISNIENDTIQFAILFISDTGAFNSPRTHTEPNPQSFDSPEDSETRVVFQIGKNGWKPEGYNNGPFFSHKSPNEFEVHEENKFFVAKSYLLSDLIDEQGIYRVLNDFIDFSETKGIKGFFSDISVTQE